MQGRPPFSSPTRFRYAWKVWRSFRAETKGQFHRAIQLLDEAGEIMPLLPSNRVERATLLLRAQRIGESHAAFSALRDEFKGSDNPALQYLRHYCTVQLSLLMGSPQWSYEAKQAKSIDCSFWVKRRFPLVTIDEIHDSIKPRP